MASTKLITVDGLIAKVKELGTAYPEAVYVPVNPDPKVCGCKYTAGACGPGIGCIFGQALLALDPSVRDKLTEVDLEESGFGAALGTVLLDLGVINREQYNEDPLVDALTEVQMKQDKGSCWGEAIKALEGN